MPQNQLFNALACCWESPASSRVYSPSHWSHTTTVVVTGAGGGERRGRDDEVVVVVVGVTIGNSKAANKRSMNLWRSALLSVSPLPGYPLSPFTTSGWGDMFFSAEKFTKLMKPSTKVGQNKVKIIQKRSELQIGKICTLTIDQT